MEVFDKLKSIPEAKEILLKHKYFLICFQIYEYEGSDVWYEILIPEGDVRRLASEVIDMELQESKRCNLKKNEDSVRKQFMETLDQAIKVPGTHKFGTILGRTILITDSYDEFRNEIHFLKERGDSQSIAPIGAFPSFD